MEINNAEDIEKFFTENRLGSENIKCNFSMLNIDVQKYKQLYKKFMQKKIIKEESDFLDTFETKNNEYLILTLRRNVLKEIHAQPKRKYWFWTKEITEEEKNILYKEFDYNEKKFKELKIKFRLNIESFDFQSKTNKKFLKVAVNKIKFEHNEFKDLKQLNIADFKILKGKEVLFENDKKRFFDCKFKNQSLILKIENMHIKKLHKIYKIVNKYNKYKIANSNTNETEKQNSIKEINIILNNLTYTVSDKLNSIFCLSSLSIVGNEERGFLKIEDLFLMEKNTQKENFYIVERINSSCSYLKKDQVFFIDGNLNSVEIQFKKLVKSIYALKKKFVIKKSISINCLEKNNVTVDDNYHTKYKQIDEDKNSVSMNFLENIKIKLNVESLKLIDFILLINNVEIKTEENKIITNINHFNFNGISIENFTILYSEKLCVDNLLIKFDKDEFKYQKIKNLITQAKNLVKIIKSTNNDNPYDSANSESTKFIIEFSNTELEIFDLNYKDKIKIKKIKNLHFFGIDALFNETNILVSEIIISKDTLKFSGITGYKKFSTIETLHEIFSYLKNQSIFPLGDSPRKSEMSVILSDITLYDSNFTTYTDIILKSNCCLINLYVGKIICNFDCFISEIKRKSNFINTNFSIQKQNHEIIIENDISANIDSEFYRTVIFTTIGVFDIINIITTNLFLPNISKSFLTYQIKADFNLLNHINYIPLLNINKTIVLKGELGNVFEIDFFVDNQAYSHQNSEFNMLSLENIKKDSLKNKVTQFSHFTIEINELLQQNHNFYIQAKNIKLAILKNTFGVYLKVNIDDVKINIEIYKLLLIKHAFLNPNVSFDVPGFSQEIVIDCNITNLTYKNIFITDLVLYKDEINFKLNSFFDSEDLIINNDTEKNNLQLVNLIKKEFSFTLRNTCLHDHNEIQIIINDCNFYMLENYEIFLNLINLFFDDFEKFKQNSIFYDNKQTIIYLKMYDTVLKFLNNYRTEISYLEFCNNFKDEEGNFSIYKGLCVLNQYIKENIMFSESTLNLKYQNKKFFVENKDALKVLLSKPMIYNKINKKTTIKNFTDIKIQFIHDGNIYNENEEFIFSGIENEELLFKFTKDNASKKENVFFRTETFQIIFDDNFYILDFNLKNDNITIRFMNNIVFKNYTKYDLKVLVGNENISETNFYDKYEIDSFNDISIDPKKKEPLYLKLLVNKWKANPDSLLFFDGNNFCIESEFTLKSEKKAVFLFFVNDFIKIIMADLIIARKEGIKTFYVIFYPMHYLYNASNYDFVFELRNDNFKISKEIKLNGRKEITRNNNLDNHLLKNVKEPENNTDILTYSSKKKVKEPENNTGLETYSRKNSVDGENIFGKSSSLGRENIDTFHSFKNIICLPYSKNNDNLKLVYKNDNGLYDCIIITRKENDDCSIKINNEKQFKVSYYTKKRIIHSVDYLTDMCEVVIYPHFLINNFLNGDVYFDKKIILNGENQIYFKNLKVLFKYDKYFKCKTEINLNSFELFTVLKLRHKNKNIEPFEIYTKKHIFGDYEKVKTKKSNKLKIFADETEYIYAVKNIGNVYKNISIEMKYGKGKYSDTKIVNINYANILKNSTNFTFFIICENKIHILYPQNEIFIHFGKKEYLYIYFYDEFGFMPEILTTNQPCDYFYIEDHIYKIIRDDKDYLRKKGIYLPILGISYMYFSITRNEKILFKLKSNLQGKQRFFEIEESNNWPFIIHNNTDKIYKFYQKNADFRYVIYPRNRYNYCYDDLRGSKKIIFNDGKEEIELSIEDCEFNKKNLYFRIEQVGEKKIIEISDKHFNEKKIIECFSLEFLITSISVSFYDKKEILCIHMKNLKFCIKKFLDEAEEKLSIECLINGFQIDDQNIDSKCPVMLYPRNKSMNMLYFKEKNESYKDFIKFNLEIGKDKNVKFKNKSKITEVLDKDIHKDKKTFEEDNINDLRQKLDKAEINDEQNLSEKIDELKINKENEDFSYQINFLRFLIQPFHLHIEEKTIMSLLEMFVESHSYNFFLQCNECFKINCECFIEEKRIKHQIKILMLHINPVVINLNFRKSEYKRGFYTKIMKYLVENISDFKLRFNAELLTDIENSVESIFEIVMNDYKTQIFRQIFKIFVSVDFLGNIGSLTDSFSIGVKDLFYEPFLGLKEDDPKKFTLGILKGGSSFIKNTVSGVTGTISKLSSSLSKGVGLATFDKEFQNYSPVYQNLYLPEKNLNLKIFNFNKHESQSPINSGLKRFGKSITSGVSGVFNKPAEGAKDGFKGFLKGVGKGTVGLVTKPIVGIADLASGITEGIKKEIDGTVIYRLQFPRADDKEFDEQKNICFYICRKYLKIKSELFDGFVADNCIVILVRYGIIVCLEKEIFEIGLHEIAIKDSCLIFEILNIKLTDRMIQYIIELKEIEKN
ncbi:Vacuolar protein sorting-associated protein 13 [Gurleya vavrai]